ncbi:hypothetical protein HOK68_00990 [Candidatus Woesearchaeota archaeon]|jgi:hypothetical protein|nr:hypothetical protein [Candidatus Woesearchaeota archaeon]MBT4387696.1 hypothetical protein [Candidatus Woesearchaeota archaeon]MBT4595942.1 hypothetical protein [Candidatus Woesearchaeota archaeon]MBT5741072.1 hypothetical protein [Candidatus Woesearchaeota archaeon]MBT6505336.1 hypothetical protein [Candidatus Woesearchaeota archaeon]
MEEYHFYLKDQADKQSRFAFFSRAELSDTFQSKRQLTSLFDLRLREPILTQELYQNGEYHPILLSKSDTNGSPFTLGRNSNLYLLTGTVCTLFPEEKITEGERTFDSEKSLLLFSKQKLENEGNNLTLDVVLEQAKKYGGSLNLMRPTLKKLSNLEVPERVLNNETIYWFELREY